MQIEHLMSGRLSGKSLALAARALRRPKLAAIGADVLRRELGITSLAALTQGNGRLEPDLAPRAARPARALSSIANTPESPVWATTSEALTRGYRQRRFSPEEILGRVLNEADRLAERQPWLRCFWLRDEQGARSAARAASERYSRGQPLGPLDGVPVVVTEQLAVQGLPRRVGNDLPSDAPMERDAAVVARLRAEGAIIVGQTAMTELGLSPLGVNPKRPALRNPHHVERIAGGSATGAAITVSVGLTPLAIGVDGGGSIRVPAALCGVFGLKPSFGRVSRAGDAIGGSLNHVGPIGTSTRDLALCLDIVAGADASDPSSLHAPRPRSPFAASIARGVRGLRVGVDEREWSEAEPSVQRAGERALKALVESGVELVDVDIPLARYASQIGFVTVAAELGASFAQAFAQRRDAFGLDTQVLLWTSAQLGAREYLRAQALRESLRGEVRTVLLEVDALALPSTQRTALPVSDLDDRQGRLDAAGVRALCRYTFLGNLTGLPCGTVPVGLDPEGLPIGLQLVGDAWDENTILALMAELERSGPAHIARPPYHVDLLADL
jgi:aspartyl-tRNA(Asn)/glutamyl-tRNA(Gln) amidotransferase subunit A